MDTRWQHCTTAAASLGSPDPSTGASFIPWPPLPSFPTSFTVTWPWSDPVFKIPSSSFSPSRPLSQFCCFPAPVQSPSFWGGKNQRHEDPFPGLEGSDDLCQGPVSTQSPIPCKGKLIFLSRAWRRESSPSHVFLTLLRQQRVQWLLINLHMVHTTPVPRVRNAMRLFVMITSMCQPHWALVPRSLVKFYSHGQVFCWCG